MMRVLSLFSGIGGFDLAAEGGVVRHPGDPWWSRSDGYGLEVVAQVENARSPLAVLRHHWPDTPRWEDIRDVDPAELPTPDLIVGGFPCQDLSSAGLRAGLAGSRSALWWEYLRLIDRLRPRWVLVENVPGLLRTRRGRDMGAILGSLGDRGYGFAWRVLDAQGFGVPARRRRVFIVGAHRPDAAARVLLDGAFGDGPSLPTREPGPRVSPGPTDRDGYCLECGGFENHEPSCWPWHAFELQPLYGQGSKLTAVELGDGPVPTIAANRSHHPGGDRGTFIEQRGQLRRLTPWEVERFMGFPDDWTAPLTPGQRFKVLGNAVAVPVAEWILRRIAAEDSRP